MKFHTCLYIIDTLVLPSVLGFKQSLGQNAQLLYILNMHAKVCDSNLFEKYILSCNLANQLDT